jgi:hypothetical protein
VLKRGRDALQFLRVSQSLERLIAKHELGDGFGSLADFLCKALAVLFVVCVQRRQSR